MSRLTKALLLAHVALRDRREFIDRLEAIVTSRVDPYLHRAPSYTAIAPRDVGTVLLNWFGAEPAATDIRAMDELEGELRSRMDGLETTAPFTTKHHGDFSLARACFWSCRLIQPEIVIETGVAYGVTSAFILEALQLNGKGALHSVDIPPLGKDADRFVGHLVPERLRARWVLHRGTSKRILPTLLARVGRVGVFVHDSLHTYWNIIRELKAVQPYLSRPAIVLADDIHANTAFPEWVRGNNVSRWFAFRQERKQSIGGVALIE